jgi:plastocyanin
MQFVPFCATVAVGASLTFTNLDPILHTVTTEPGEPQPFDSGLLVPGQEFSYVFTAPGAVRVHDRLNPWMVGIVIVQ